MQIMSTNNNLVKQVSKLSKRKYREQSKQYLVFGKTLVNEALKAKHVSSVFYTDKDEYECEYKYAVSKAVMHKLVGEQVNTNVCAVCNYKSQALVNANTLLLDNIQDPGNLGTMIRSAKAFGFKNVVIGDGCVDLYNPKTIRSMQGVHFSMNIISSNLEHYLANSSNKLLTTFLDEPSQSLPPAHENSYFDLLVGNEGQGVDKRFKAYPHRNIIIDIDYESLNVAVAASILMHKIKEL